VLNCLSIVVATIGHGIHESEGNLAIRFDNWCGDSRGLPRNAMTEVLELAPRKPR